MGEPPLPQEPQKNAASDATSELEKARARGRRVAYAIYLLIAGAIGVGGGTQIFIQAFQRRESSEIHITSCSEGLSRLSSAVDRARTAASGTDGEDAALARFRDALRPEWDDRDHIEDLCRSSPSSMAMLDAIEQLRYAEEHAVRREAADLAPLRRRVQAIAPQGVPSTGSASGASPTDSTASPTSTP